MAAGVLLGLVICPARPGLRRRRLVRIPRGLWRTLVAEARKLNLPTQFLEQIPAQFVAFEFEDLHAFAAEYHPVGASNGVGPIAFPECGGEDVCVHWGG